MVCPPRTPLSPPPHQTIPNKPTGLPRHGMTLLSSVQLKLPNFFISIFTPGTQKRSALQGRRCRCRRRRRAEANRVPLVLARRAHQLGRRALPRQRRFVQPSLPAPHRGRPLILSPVLSSLWYDTRQHHRKRKKSTGRNRTNDKSKSTLRVRKTKRKKKQKKYTNMYTYTR